MSFHKSIRMDVLCHGVPAYDFLDSCSLMFRGIISDTCYTGELAHVSFLSPSDTEIVLIQACYNHGIMECSADECMIDL